MAGADHARATVRVVVRTTQRVLESLGHVLMLVLVFRLIDKVVVEHNVFALLALLIILAIVDGLAHKARDQLPGPCVSREGAAPAFEKRIDQSAASRASRA